MSSFYLDFVHQNLTETDRDGQETESGIRPFKKSPAHGRPRISRCVLIVAPIQKKTRIYINEDKEKNKSQV